MSGSNQGKPTNPDHALGCGSLSEYIHAGSCAGGGQVPCNVYLMLFSPVLDSFEEADIPRSASSGHIEGDARGCRKGVAFVGAAIRDVLGRHS